MGDILGTAVSGLLSFQRALSTTSHNIANVNTEGYSRQNVELDTRNPSYLGGFFVGNGVQVNAIERSYDDFITTTLRESNSSYARLEKFADLSAQIDNILADPQGGISPILQQFFSAVQDVSDDPASGSARNQLLSTAESLVNRFSSFDTRLSQLSRNTETDIETSINEINQIVSSIADINLNLEEAFASGLVTQQSNDLLDQRDALLYELSTKVNIQVINPQANNMTVLIGNGQTMLNGSTSFSLSLQPDQTDPTQNIIVYNGFSTVNDVSDQLNGGELGGLLDYRNTVLNPTINSVGRIAMGLADTFNAQHREGMDLNGALGGDFFSFSQPRTIPYTSNTGTSSISTTVTDVSQLTIDDYTLNYNAGNWQLISSSGSTSATVADASPADTTLVFEGLTVVIDGASTPANGDQFTIKPTSQGALTIDLAISDPNAIAAAAPVRTESALSNMGDIEISQGSVSDATNTNLLNTVNFTFESPATSFTSSSDVVVGGTFYAAGASIPYSNNMVVDSNGWQVTLSGVNPQPNDTLTIEANLGGTGDNRNMLELAGLQTTGFFDNGANNYLEAYSILTGQVGSATQSAQIDRDAQGSLLAQAQERRSQISGVNLDEEAADLIKFQQAYQAAARVISTAQQLFETLVNSTR